MTDPAGIMTPAGMTGPAKKDCFFVSNRFIILSMNLQKRRQRIAKSLPKGSALILASSAPALRQPDVFHPYRQESHFYYLTAFEQERSLFVLLPSSRSLLFIKDKNPLKEVWDGPIYGKNEVKKKYGFDEVYTLSQLDSVLAPLLKKTKSIFYDKQDPFFHSKIKGLGKSSRKNPSAFEFLKDFRRVKSPQEIQKIKTACSYSIQAHKQVAKALKANQSEHSLHAVFIHSIMSQGAKREAYPGIFACGQNAVTLHYIKNDSLCRKGELLLVDAGAEHDYYASDITRVYPVSGRFTKKQALLYQSLLDLQKQLIKKVSPKLSLKDLNQHMFSGLTQILLEFGLLKGSFKNNLRQKKYQKYCPHSVGHLLGLDVHDLSFKKGENSQLKPNMLLTIEPGIYIDKKDKQAPAELRGVGLRIEDDILVTSKGSQNLTQKLTKEIEEIEELCSA